MVNHFRNKSGFTLLELLIVVAVLVIIAAMSRDFFGSFVGGASLRNENTSLMFNLRGVRDKAMNGQNDMNWGMHLVNGTQDYYEIFSSPTNYSSASTTIASKVYLSNNIFFSTPAEGFSADIIFSKITGTTTAAEIILTSKGEDSAISISNQGFVASGAATPAQAASANLTSLILSGSPTNYTFVGGTYIYNGVGVLNDVASITVTPTGAGVITVDGVTVSSGQASAGINLTPEVEKTITVVATETDKSAKTYTIKITRAAPAQFLCGQIFIDPRDSNSYSTVQIDTQCWFAKNLAYLPSVSPSNVGDTTNPYYYVYDYQGTNVATAKAQANYASYGVLYNHPASLISCPAGWHLPSDAEWTTLVNYVTWAPGCDIYSGCQPGLVLKARSIDPVPFDGTNIYNFSIVPGGRRHSSWGFVTPEGGYYWSSSLNATNAWYRQCYTGDGRVNHESIDRDSGHSVRCLKD